MEPHGRQVSLGLDECSLQQCRPPPPPWPPSTSGQDGQQRYPAQGLLAEAGKEVCEDTVWLLTGVWEVSSEAM